MTPTLYTIIYGLLLLTILAVICYIDWLTEKLKGYKDEQFTTKIKRRIRKPDGRRRALPTRDSDH